MGGDEFLGDQVEAVAQRRDPADVSGAVVAQRVGERHRRGRQQDGLPRQGADVPVDAADQLLDRLLRLLVGAHAVGRGHGGDQQLDLAVQLGAPLQQPFVGHQHFARALGVVDAADRDDDLLLRNVAADLRDLRQLVVLLYRLADQLGVGADGKGVDPDLSAAAPDRHRRHRFGQCRASGTQFIGYLAFNHLVHRTQRLHGGDEIACVARNVKAHQIAGQQAVDDLVAPRQDVEDIRRRKRRVMEEGDAHIGTHLAHERRHQPQVVVVHPDHGPGRGFLAGRFGEQAVDFAEGGPVAIFSGVQRGETVENRPQRLLRGDMVELADLFAGQGQAHHFVAAITVFHGDAAFEFRRLAGRRLFPGDPARALGLSDEALERGHDAVGAGIFPEYGLAADDMLFIGLPVIDDDQ